MKTYLEVLNETVEFYRTDTSRRSIEGNRCLYNGPGGRKCAFSRCCLNVYFREGCSAKGNLEKMGWEILSEEYRNLKNADFWNDLQLLHDLDTNWDLGGLTSSGVDMVNKFRLHIESGKYSINTL